MSILARRLAVIVSWIGHPLVFVTVTVAIALTTQLAPRTAVSLLAAMFLVVIVPMGLLLFLGMRSGRWTDADVSVRRERKRFYPVAIPILAAGTLAMWLTGAPYGVLRGGIVSVILLVIAGIINIWFKISLHMLFAAFCTVLLFRVNGWCGAVSAVLAALVFWSRIFLGRHTVGETVAGGLLGVAGGIVTSWI